MTPDQVAAIHQVLVDECGASPGAVPARGVDPSLHWCNFNLHLRGERPSG